MINVNIPRLDANTLLTNGLNLLYFATGLIAVLAIIVAGFMYVISRGDPGEIAKAKNTILYAIVGLVVVSVAFTITNFIVGRF